MTVEQLWEIGVLATLALPGVRVASSSAYRRVFPFDSLRIGAVTAIYLAAVVAVAVYAPGWLRALSIPAAAAVAYLAWRARPSYGVMTSAEPRVAAVFHDALAAMAEESARAGKVVVRTAFMRMMFAAWAELFYGIDAAHPDFARLKQLFRVIDARKARWSSRRRVGSALAEIEAILDARAKTLVPARADDSLVSPPSCFLAALARSDPAALKDRTILGNLVYIMQITWGDVTGLLLWVFKMLSDNPEWKERLAKEPSRDLATRIVLETLRLEQSESRYRRTTSDLTLDGFRIPKGWLVRMCIRESHRDETVFPDARVFDPDRFCGRAFTRGEYAPFGAFRLACIGEDITKAVAGTFALELACGFDWRVVEDGPARISSWVHNAPSPRLSVAMTARARAS